MHLQARIAGVWLQTFRCLVGGGGVYQTPELTTMKSILALNKDGACHTVLDRAQQSHLSRPAKLILNNSPVTLQG